MTMARTKPLREHDERELANPRFQSVIDRVRDVVRC